MPCIGLSIDFRRLTPSLTLWLKRQPKALTDKCKGPKEQRQEEGEGLGSRQIVWPTAGSAGCYLLYFRKDCTIFSADFLTDLCVVVVVVLFCFVLFCFVLFCFVLFCFVLFCLVLFGWLVGWLVGWLFFFFFGGGGEVFVFFFSFFHSFFLGFFFFFFQNRLNIVWSFTNQPN